MSLGIHRRTFLAASASALACATTAEAFAQARTLRRRARVFDAVQPPDLAIFKSAVTALLNLPPSDPRNWYRLAIVHILDCPHQNWWFLPWHRAYLQHVERICAAVTNTPTFALPYWDWTQSASLPSAFFDPALDTSSSNFLHRWTDFETQIVPAVKAAWSGFTPQQLSALSVRGYTKLDDLISGPNGLAAHFSYGPIRTPTAQRPTLSPSATRAVSPSRIQACLQPARYEDFAGFPAAQHSEMPGERALETGPHDNIHGGVGGFMSAWLSPIDPIFWLHHANLDRLWDVWNRARVIRKEDVLPVDPGKRDTLLKEPYLFFADEAGQAVARTASDYMSSSALGYDYEPGAGEETLSAFLNQRSAAKASAFFSTGPINERFRINREASARVAIDRSILKGIEESDVTLVARIAVALPSLPGAIRFRVYVNCPYLSAQTPVDDDHYVGAITPFATSADMGGAHGHTQIFTLPLNPALERLSESGRPAQTAVRVQLIAEMRDGSDAAIDLDGAIREITIERI